MSDNKFKVLSAKVSVETWKAVKLAALEADTTASALVAKVIEDVYAE